MQELDSRIVLLLMFVLDLTAFGLTMAAETKTKATLHQLDDGTVNCEYGSDIATGMAVASMFLLLASQTIVTVATQCLCFGKILNPGNWRISAIVLFFTCWNASLANYRTLKNLPCSTLSSGVFGTAAVLIVAIATTSQTYYVSYVKTDASCGSLPLLSNNGIGMGTN